METAPLDQTQQRHFSPWRDSAQRACATCTHSLGIDGPHYWCQHHRIVVVMPCGCWEREPGTDA
jgi:hypothetical protein